MIVTEWLKAEGFPNAEELSKRLENYNDKVILENQKVNITGIRQAEESMVKNIYDSLTVYDKAYFPEKAHYLDLGTGAGFPGVPLAIIRPDIQAVLMDSIEKKLCFIEKAAEEMKIPNVKCIHVRAEEAGKRRKMRETFDIVTARAVKMLPVVVEWALPFVKVGGVFAAMKGPKALEELQQAQKIIALLGGKVERKKEFILPTGEKRVILYIRKETASPKNYPRKVGIAERDPIIG